MDNFRQAQADYEYKMFCPYEDEDEVDDSQYWAQVDAQMEDFKMGDL